MRVCVCTGVGVHLLLGQLMYSRSTWEWLTAHQLQGPEQRGPVGRHKTEADVFDSALLACTLRSRQNAFQNGLPEDREAGAFAHGIRQGSVHPQWLLLCP